MGRKLLGVCDTAFSEGFDGKTSFSFTPGTAIQGYTTIIFRTFYAVK